MRITFDLLPYPAYMNVDASFDRSGKTAMGELQELFAGEHAVGIATKCEQQVEFGTRHLHLDAVGIADLQGRRIDLPTLENQHIRRNEREALIAAGAAQKARECAQSARAC